MENKYQEDDCLDFMEIFHAILEKILVIILCGFIGAGAMAAYCFTLATPIYESTARMYVLTKSTSITSLADIQLSSSLASDYIEMITCRPVINEVIRNLGLQASYKDVVNMVEVSNPSNTRILNISVYNPDSELAAQIANEIADVSKLSISNIMNTDAPKVFQKAIASSKPIKPNKTKSIALGFLIGLFIPCVIISIKVITNTALQNDEKIERLLGYSVLAHVPNEKAVHVNPEKA